VASPANPGGDDDAGLSAEALEAQGGPDGNVGGILAGLVAVQPKKQAKAQAPPAAMGGF
jgi:hypothetical protein